MDQTRREEKTKKVIAKMSSEELSWTLGRYCGKSNSILSEKKYGFVLDRKTVEKAIPIVEFEEAFFGNDT
jgi:hypothetical protein